MAPRLNLEDLWRGACEVALTKLADAGRPARPLPDTCPFTVAELLNRQLDLDALLARIGGV